MSEVPQEGRDPPQPAVRPETEARPPEADGRPSESHSAKAADRDPHGGLFGPLLKPKSLMAFGALFAILATGLGSMSYSRQNWLLGLAERGRRVEAVVERLDAAPTRSTATAPRSGQVFYTRPWDSVGVHASIADLPAAAAVGTKISAIEDAAGPVYPASAVERWRVQSKEWRGVAICLGIVSVLCFGMAFVPRAGMAH